MKIIKTSDLEYIKDGMFTRFIPNTPQGENAWRTMLESGATAFLNIVAINVIHQLKAAGYTVRKAKKPKQSIEDILKELEA